jgi:hypothetical protein
MAKPQKSELIKEIDMKLINDSMRGFPQRTVSYKNPCIANVMTNIRKIKTKDIQTFKNF